MWIFAALSARSRYGNSPTRVPPLLLSIAHKFVFVRAVKVGGTSVEIGLSAICGPDDILPPMVALEERRRQALGVRSRNYGASPLLEVAYDTLVRETPDENLHRVPQPPSRFSAHTRLSEVIEHYPGSLEGFTAVCLARSPYARVLSALNMQGNYKAYTRGADMRTDPKTWADAFDKHIESGWLKKMFSPDVYGDPTGRLDRFVIHYERLQDDFDAFLARLGVPDRIVLPHAKEGMMSNRFDPRDVLRLDQIATINDMFSDDFEAFGYARL